jgi:hypothetical protein
MSKDEIAHGVYGYRVTYLSQRRNGAGSAEVSYGARSSQCETRQRAHYKADFLRLVAVTPLSAEQYDREFPPSPRTGSAVASGKA